MTAAEATKRDADVDVPDVFAGLLTGTWTVVGRQRDGDRRYLMAQHVPAGSTSLLGDDARCAIERATRGVANKVIAIDLGVSEPTVTRLLARAVSGLGLVDMSEAIALASARPTWCVAGAPTRAIWRFERGLAPSWQKLSEAERDVVQRIVDGASRAETARARGTSIYAVNSQLASAFRKLGVGSKRELLASVAGN